MGTWSYPAATHAPACRPAGQLPPLLNAASAALLTLNAARKPHQGLPQHTSESIGFPCCLPQPYLLTAEGQLPLVVNGQTVACVPGDLPAGGVVRAIGAREQPGYADVW